MNVPLLIEFTKRDFLDRYAGSALGSAWAVLAPLFSVAIYYLVFSKVMGDRLSPQAGFTSYAIYLIAGIIPWTAFANTLIRATTIYVDKRNVITKIPLSIVRLPLYIALSETLSFLISMAIFMLFLSIFGEGFSPIFLLALPLVAIQQLLALALGSIAAVCNVFFRDVKELVPVVVQIWFWLTPIVYVVDILPDAVQSWLFLNPLLNYIGMHQQIFLHRTMPPWSEVLTLAALAVLLYAAAALLLSKLEKEIRDFA